MNRLPLLLRTLGLAALTVAAGACSDTPTEPDEVLNFSGTVLFEGSSFHEISAPSARILRLRPVAYTQTLADGTVNEPSPLLPGLRLGTTVDSLCLPTSTTAFLAVGETTSFRVDPGEFCVQAFDSGFFPEGSKIDYEIAVEVEVF